MSHHHFGLFMESECWGRVECNSVPHKLRLLSRDAAFFQEVASRIRAVYLEAILPVVPLGQTEIVQAARAAGRTGHGRSTTARGASAVAAMSRGIFLRDGSAHHQPLFRHLDRG